uniref:Uncharacterized protein n=1 Tax=Arundo donax TaxID=35708 RepID=A0A0A8Z6F1_ARUDO
MPPTWLGLPSLLRRSDRVVYRRESNSRSPRRICWGGGRRSRRSSTRLMVCTKAA